MTLDDLRDFSNRDNYVVALGFAFSSKPEEIVIAPKSKLERYRRGDYEFQVIEEQQLLPTLTKQGILETLESVCSKYGPVSIQPRGQAMTHEERLIAARDASARIIQMPFAHSVYLTGSTAVGLDMEYSDVDLLVVLDQCFGDRTHNDIESAIPRDMVDFHYMQLGDFLRAQGEYPLISDAILLASKP